MKADHNENMADGVKTCLACGVQGQWEGPCPSCNAVVAEIDYANLSTSDLRDIRDTIATILNRRNSVLPWYGIWVKSESAWLTPSFLPTTDAEKAIRRRKASTLDGWMTEVYFRNKQYKGVQVLELPIARKDSGR